VSKAVKVYPAPHSDKRYTKSSLRYRSKASPQIIFDIYLLPLIPPLLDLKIENIKYAGDPYEINV